MDSLEYQPIYPVSDRSSPIFLIAAALAALCGVAALSAGIYGLLAMLLGRSSGIEPLTALLATAGGAGVLVLETLAFIRKSDELTSVIGTGFGAVPFIVLPAIVERFLYIMSIPGIKQASTWSQAGAFAALGVFCGFIGYAHFAEVRRMRMFRSLHEPATAGSITPPPETAP
jgi:hypothetical protein